MTGPVIPEPRINDTDGVLLETDGDPFPHPILHRTHTYIYGVSTYIYSGTEWRRPYPSSEFAFYLKIQIYIYISI